MSQYNSLDEYRTAAKAAHAQGNTEEAKRLFNEAKSSGLYKAPTKAAVAPTGAIDYNNTPIRKDIEWQSLSQDQAWVSGSTKFFEMTKGRKPTYEDLKGYEGTTLEERVADYGLKQMAGFNYNIGDMALDTKRVTESDQETKDAFVYMLDTYDNVNTSFHTAGQATWEAFTDVTNLLGVFTGGATAASSQVAKKAGKTGIKALVRGAIHGEVADTSATVGLRHSIKRIGAPAAVEGAAHGGASSALDQAVRIDQGSQEEFSYAGFVSNIALGGTAGLVLGTGIDLGVSKVTSKVTQKKLAKLVEREKTVIRTRAQSLQREIDSRGANAAGKAGDPNTSIIDGQVTKVVDGETPKTISELDLAGSLPTVADFHKLASGGVEAVDGIIADLEGMSLPLTGWSEMKTRINKTRQDLTKDVLLLDGKLVDEADPVIRKGILNTLEGSTERMNTLEAIAAEVNAYSGRDLQDIQNYLIAKSDDGEVTPEALEMAAEKFYKSQINKVRENFDPLFSKALKDGDLNEFNRLQDTFKADVEMWRANLELTTPDATLADAATHKIEQFVELSISGVFSPATVGVNFVWPLIKTIIYPAWDTLLTNPLNLQKLRNTTATYGYMMSSTGAALRSAKAAFDFEQTLLTQDPSRFLDGGIKVKGKTGGLLRTFPRLLGAGDAFNQEMAAAGYLAARAADELIEEGITKGLAGVKLQKFINERIGAKVEHGYSRELDTRAIQPLLEKGQSLNLKDDKLNKFIVDQMRSKNTPTIKAYDDIVAAAGDLTGDELNAKIIKEMKAKKPRAVKSFMIAAKNDLHVEFPDRIPTAEALNSRVIEKIKNERGDTFKRLSDPDAKEYVETLLYKQEFDGQGSTDATKKVFGAAKWVEDLHKKNPILKVFGQLFFRTPVWVFHESLRLTPGINAVMPQFRNDLAGVNGQLAQARATTEASVGFALSSWAMTQWAQGNLKGSPSSDYNKTAEQETSGLSPLNLQIGDSVVDYRKFEPFRIPLSMIANTLDGVQATIDATNQGVIDDTAMEKASQGMTLAFSMLVSTIRDSNLLSSSVETIEALFQVVELSGSDDVQDKGKAMDKILDTGFKKLLMPAPSVIKKTQVALGADQMTSIYSKQQRLLSLYSPNDTRIPRKYDSLGNFRKVQNPKTALNPFATRDAADTNSDRTPQQQEIIDHLAVLEEQGYGNFSRHNTKAPWSKEDLRGVTTTHTDGSTISVFDAVMLEYKRTNNKLERKLLRQVRSKKPLGRPDNPAFHGKPVTEIRQALTEHRQKSLETVIKRDPALRQMVKDHERTAKLSQRGLFNIGN